MCVLKISLDFFSLLFTPHWSSLLCFFLSEHLRLNKVAISSTAEAFRAATRVLLCVDKSCVSATGLWSARAEKRCRCCCLLRGLDRHAAHSRLGVVKTPFQASLQIRSADLFSVRRRLSTRGTPPYRWNGGMRSTPLTKTYPSPPWVPTLVAYGCITALVSSLFSPFGEWIGLWKQEGEDTTESLFTVCVNKLRSQVDSVSDS